MKSICVFCGGNPGKSPRYVQEATVLGRRLAELNIRLVYGGASLGVMGAVADAVLAAGGKVLGIIPQSLFDKEVAHRGLTELRVVGSMHERKKMMFDNSDGFLTLPGGFGTLDETFEMLTWIQIGLHKKPIVLLNTDGFYDPLLSFIDHAVNAGFVRPEHRKIVTASQDIDTALQILTRE